MDHELELLDKIISSCSSSCYPPSTSKKATIFTRKLAFEEGISLGVVLPLLIKQHMQPNVVNMPEIFWLISNLVTSTLLFIQIIICHEREWERELKSLFCQISWSDLGTQSFFSLWTGAGTKSLFSWTSNTLQATILRGSIFYVIQQYYTLNWEREKRGEMGPGFFCLNHGVFSRRTVVLVIRSVIVLLFALLTLLF